MPESITLEQFADLYVKRAVAVRPRNKSWTNDKYQLGKVAEFRLENGTRFGDKPLHAVTEDDLEAVIVWLRAKKLAASTVNQYVQVIRAAFRWAVKKAYLVDNPLDDESAVKRAKAGQRHRRLRPDVFDEKGTLIEAGEERQLLRVADARLQNLIIAALETCCRRGELLNLQWRDVSLERGELLIRAENAKDDDTRILPISGRLLAVLKMAQTDPAGDDYGADDYVFGELGKRVKTTKRAWDTAVLKAHGHKPIWASNSKLAPESRKVLDGIDLHFHDLRHEAGSRLLDAGWPLTHVRDMLGHASIEQTDTYLQVQRGGLHESMRKLDEARSRCNSVVKAATIEHRSPYDGKNVETDKEHTH
jgi:integrase